MKFYIACFSAALVCGISRAVPYRAGAHQGSTLDEISSRQSYDGRITSSYDNAAQVQNSQGVLSRLPFGSFMTNVVKNTADAGRSILDGADHTLDQLFGNNRPNNNQGPNPSYTHGYSPNYNPNNNFGNNFGYNQGNNHGYNPYNSASLNYNPNGMIYNSLFYIFISSKTNDNTNYGMNPQSIRCR